jgi:hypothetical protein
MTIKNLFFSHVTWDTKPILSISKWVQPHLLKNGRCGMFLLNLKTTNSCTNSSSVLQLYWTSQGLATLSPTKWMLQCCVLTLQKFLSFNCWSFVNPLQEISSLLYLSPILLQPHKVLGGMIAFDQSDDT